jgi:hypothetical protein
MGFDPLYRTLRAIVPNPHNLDEDIVADFKVLSSSLLFLKRISDKTGFCSILKLLGSLQGARSANRG